MSDFSPDESLLIVFGGNANLRLDSKSFLWVGSRLLFFKISGTNEDAGIQTIPPKNSCSRLWLGRVGQGAGSRRPSDERVRSIEHKWAAKIYDVDQLNWTHE